MVKKKEKQKSLKKTKQKPVRGYERAKQALEKLRKLRP